MRTFTLIFSSPSPHNTVSLSVSTVLLVSAFTISFPPSLSVSLSLLSVSLSLVGSIAFLMSVFIPHFYNTLYLSALLSQCRLFPRLSCSHSTRFRPVSPLKFVMALSIFSQVVGLSFSCQSSPCMLSVCFSARSQSSLTVSLQVSPSPPISLITVSPAQQSSPSPSSLYSLITVSPSPLPDPHPLSYAVSSLSAQPYSPFPHPLPHTVSSHCQPHSSP
jgi:hypothetical protein